MAIQINDNGTLRQLRVIQVNDNGVLRNCYLVQVNDGGVLRSVPLAHVTLKGGLYSDTRAITPGAASVLIQWRPDGTVWVLRLNGDDEQVESWVKPEALAPGDYEIRFTVLSGDPAVPSGWLPLTSQRTISAQREDVAGVTGGEVLVEIGVNSGATILDSATYTAQAHVL